MIKLIRSMFTIIWEYSSYGIIEKQKTLSLLKDRDNSSSAENKSDKHSYQ